MKELKFRGFHYALGQGNYDDWPSLWRLAPFAADCGFNKLIFYMDSAWKLKRHPELADPRRAYSPEEMGRFASYAKSCGLELIPSISTISHAWYIESRKPRLRMCKNGRLDVFNPAVYDLFEEIFDEILPHFESPYVFLNGDEMELSNLNERAKRIAVRQGLGAIHGHGLGKLCQMIIRRGRRPIVWHDMLVHHPEGLAYIPKKTVIAYWFYDYQPQYPAIRYFCERGYDVITASATGELSANPRELWAIQGQAYAAARAEKKQNPSSGRCLGTMATEWETCKWYKATLGLYAAGRWSLNPTLPMDQVLTRYAQHVFGVNASDMGHRLFQAGRDMQSHNILQTAPFASGSKPERNVFERDIQIRRKKVGAVIDRVKKICPERNRDLYQLLLENMRSIESVKRPVSTQSAKRPEKLIGLSLTGPDDRICRLVEGKTQWGHRVLVLTNGLISVTILPEFGGAMIEWILHERIPWSILKNQYTQWASGESRLPIDKNPGMGSPWGASGILGWREAIFYNARVNPCTLWGHPFDVSVLSQSTRKITVECQGQNEAAKVRRLVTLEYGMRTIEIEVTATNRRETCWLAIQPNACHALPDVSAPLLRLTEERPSQRKSCSILDHNGTMIFTPEADRIHVGSPLSGHYIRLDCPRSQTWGILSQVCGSWFTLEPYGRIRQCRKEETVRLHLKYELA